MKPMEQDFNANATADKKDEPSPPPPEEEVQRRDDSRFRAEVDGLIKDAEAMRVARMRAHRNRGFVTMTVGLISIMAGAAGFGWYLLMEAKLAYALACMVGAVIVPLILNIWAQGPLKAYKQDYKRRFMPRMAKALGGLKFHPTRGIGHGLLGKTGVVPPHKRYEAEDCFLGRYKDVKVIMSEARLFDAPKGGHMIFDGVFVMMEVPKARFEGHTIVTADQDMVSQWLNTRWKSLQAVQISASTPEAKRFQVITDKPQQANKIISDRLLKELAEAADIFDQAPLTAVLFRSRFIFLMIPYDGDMFEASSIHVPITTNEHALRAKQEIERIMEIIDVFEIYDTHEPELPA